MSGNGDDGLDGITVTSAVDVCCVTAPGSDAVGLSSAARLGRVRGVCMTALELGCRVCYQDSDFPLFLRIGQFDTTVCEPYSCRRMR